MFNDDYNNENGDITENNSTASKAESESSYSCSDSFTDPAADSYHSSAPSYDAKPKREKKYYSLGALVATSAVTIVLCVGLMFLILCTTPILGNVKNNEANASGTSVTSAPTEKPDAVKETPSLGLNIGTADASASDEAGTVIEKCSRSIVSINVEVIQSSYFGDSVSTGSGSGVVLTKDGYIATCYHVIDGANTINVSLQDGATYEAEVIGFDSRTDIAIIKIDADDLPAATIGDSTKYSVGDPIYAIGNPLGEFASTVTDGIISGLDRVIEVDGISMTLMQTNAAINPGNSGGGLFSAETGELIGIVNAKSYGIEIEGIGFAIPTSSAKSIITDLMDLGYVTGRPYIGISMREYTTSSNPFHSFMGEVEKVVKITAVSENSPAEKAGVKAGDVIVSLGGQEITSIDSLSSVLNNYNAGDKVDMVVSRENKQVTLSITLGEASGK